MSKGADFWSLPPAVRKEVLARTGEKMPPKFRPRKKAEKLEIGTPLGRVCACGSIVYRADGDYAGVDCAGCGKPLRGYAKRF